MKYRFIYDENYYRTIPACIIDARKGTPLANQIGSVIKAYTDSEVAKVIPGVYPFKIEALLNGGLVGFITISTLGNAPFVYQQIIRPNFQYDITGITTEISSFITGNSWIYDTL